MTHECAIKGCKRASRTQICGPCTDEIHDMLRGLVAGEPGNNGRPSAGWLDYLDDACNGQTKLGEQARHITEHDAALPVNFDARSLQRRTAATIVSWAIVLHAEFIDDLRQPRSWRKEQPRAAATWLADNVEAIASHQHVAQLHADIKRTIAAIEHTINRRRPPRYCGPCPAPHPKLHGKRCGLELTANRRANIIRCPQCSTEHRVEGLIRENLAGIGHWNFRAHELLRILDGFEIPISKTTFYRWRRENKLQPALFEADGTPLFRFADVQKLANQTITRHTSDTPIHTTGA